MPKTVHIAVLACALLFCNGCAVRRAGVQTWRLVATGGDRPPVLIPPGVEVADLPRRTFTADLVPGPAHCMQTGDAVTLQAHKGHLRVTASRAALIAQPPGWLSLWAADLEAKGCLAAGEAPKLAESVAESLPLDQNLAFRLLNAGDRRTGQVDLGPGVRLEVTSPLVREGAVPDSPLQVSGAGNSLTVTAPTDLLGYEDAWYSVQANPHGSGFTIQPGSAERHIGDAVEPRPAPATNYLSFPPDAAFYRLLYKSGQTDFTAIVIAARTLADVDRVSKLAQSGEVSCRKAEDLCVAIPKRVAINAFVPVTVNGREVSVSWGATLAEAIRDSGEPQPSAVLPRLTVYKRYDGRPAEIRFAASPAILDLVLTGGEVVAWKQPFEPTGNLVDVGGYRVHLHCTGEGKPTVMILGGGFSFDWELVQTDVEKFTRVCTYDPSGTAWSDPAHGVACRDRVEEIHNLIRAAAIPGPYVLVGLSTGALITRLYAADYPEQVAGMVIVDHAFFPEDSRPVGGTPPPLPGLDSAPVLISKTPIVATVEDDPAFARLPERIRQMHRWADSRNPALPTAQIAQTCSRQVAAAEKGDRPLGSKPLVIVSTANDSPGYSELQSKLLSLSANSRQLIAAKSFHSVEISEPQVVSAAIRQAVDAVRKETK